MLRLVASDMDGTLLRRDGSVSDRTRRALVGVQDGGATVVLVTARAPDTLRPLALAAGISTLALCCNGAVAYDVERDAVLRATNGLSALSPYALQRTSAPGLMAVACGPVGDGRRHPFFAASRRSVFSRTRRRTGWQVGRDFSSLLGRLDRPLLVLLGGSDRFPARGDAKRVRAAVAPGGRIVTIPEAGHVLLPSAAVERAAAEIDAFLR